ncbi:MAG: N-acetyltransferase [Helicobacteraceae bacterium]|jgi:amino-acid N-acetyltransferase|nr:N-acetyltransferase [Helicobacteraceae bacterium]
MELVKAKLSDIAEMQRLVKPYIDEGLVLARSDEEVANMIRSYTIARDNGAIVGFAALYIYTQKLGEIRSLAVEKSRRDEGVGGAIALRLIEEAKFLGLEQILTLTYRASFFRRLGFKEAPKEEVWHHKVWEDCIRCKRFPVCDETALILEI